MENRDGRYRLAPFVYERLKNHTTPLGDNPILKPDGDIPMDYSLAKERYREVVDAVTECFGRVPDTEAAKSRYGELLDECRRLEEPHRDRLENLVHNAVSRMFEIPIETVNIECEIVDGVKPEVSVNVKPQPIGGSFRFRDTDDMENMSMAVMKRRFIDCMLIGGAMALSTDEAFYAKELYGIEPELLGLYREMDAVYQYLLFTVQPKVNEKDPHLNGYVETFLGRGADKTRIHAQGENFPILLHETIKGLMELFVAKGLPDDGRRASMIVAQADYLLAEPWDMRLGPKIWERFSEGLEDTALIPYYMSEVSMLDTERFVSTMREIMNDTESGEERKRDMLSTSAMKKGGNASAAGERMMDTTKGILSDGTEPSNVTETRRRAI